MSQDKVRLVVIPNLGLGSIYPYSSLEDARREIRPIQNSFKIVGIKAWYIVGEDEDDVLASRGWAPDDLKMMLLEEKHANKAF
jgi:hypothetical protein